MAVISCFSFSNLEIYLASLACCCSSKLSILFCNFFEPSLLYIIYLYIFSLNDFFITKSISRFRLMHIFT